MPLPSVHDRHIQIITHQGKQILLIDLSGCSAVEIEKTMRGLPEIVTAQPRDSVLILADFTGAEFSEEAVRTMKETAVFHKAYVKKSAWVGAENIAANVTMEVKQFSRRTFTLFSDRGQALAWLAKE
jgi:hypothetical protein